MGALVLQQFGLVFLAQADNKNLRTNVVALGMSTHPGDKTLPVWHHGMDIDTAMVLSTKYGDRRLNKVPAAYWHSPVDIACKAPEDGNKRRVWTVQFVCVPQMFGTNVASSSKGLFPVELFQYYFEFGQEDLTSNVDVTIIIGNFFPSETVNPKLLCIKFGRMITGVITDDNAHSMFACFQNLTGKSGFDIRRRDGSAGIVTPQSDVNLLALLPHLHSTVPRKIWGTYILRSKFMYRIFYKRAVSNETKTAHGHMSGIHPPIMVASSNSQSL